MTSLLEIDTGNTSSLILQIINGNCPKGRIKVGSECRRSNKIFDDIQ